jgi:YD repeat-containing protein
MRRATLPLLAAGLLAVAAPLASASSAATPTGATYRPYAVGFNSGEPSIGYDLKADAAMFTADTTTVRMTWDAKGRLTTKDVSAPNAVTSLDPIGFTDPRTHRSFTSQLALACSLLSFSDDAGASWTPSSGCGPATMLDHQTVGGGPYRAEAKPPTAGLTGYPDAVYYCAQNGYSGVCARSDDGGLTFPFSSPAYNAPGVTSSAPDGGACSAIHGHLKVAPDGVVYLPNKGCGGTPTAGNLTNSEFFGGGPAVSVSEDNGQTWTVRRVPGAHNQDESDPSIAFDSASTGFFGWEDGTNPSETTYGRTSAAKISVTRDHGKTWSKPYDVSSPLGLHNVQFPEVIAGDAGRAAFAFLGTKGIGDDQHNGFVGAWHLYVATTVDGGRTWKTVDTTPNDPVQRGCISLQGTSNKNVADANLCTQRNLLDFNDIALDRQGRVLVAYTDGCVGACVTHASSGSTDAVSMVMRQTSGPLLYRRPHLG